ncbi:MAG: hypothetical protein CMA28_02240 [Euryarchaeota archaeon]|nr:hypothetical protein [Euryarchaeota archaeon]
MAAVPWREEALEKVVNSLLPQVDELNIYLNDWEKIPSFLDHTKINAVRSQNEIGDIGDRGKFYWCNKIKGIHLTVDDDILYPANYVEKIVEGMNRNKRSVVTFHGSILNTPKFSEKQTVSHFAREVQSDVLVTIGGTGVMAYNTENLKIDFDSFKCDYWADGWFAIQAMETGVPIIALRHEQGWLQPLPTDGPDIWGLNKKEDRASQIDSWILEYLYGNE